MKPSVSIIIVSYNAKEHLIDCLRSFFDINTPISYEVIVLDNASDDGSCQALEEQFGNKITLLANQKNVGFGGGNNLAVKEASGDYLFFLNSDTIITEDLLAPVLRLFDNKEIGIVAPRLLLDDGREQSYAYGYFPGILTPIWGRKTMPENKQGGIMAVDWVSGAAFFIKKDLFLKVGGFDENYFMYFEDIDLCHAVQKQGLKNVVAKDLSLIHLGGKGLKDAWKRKALYYKAQDYYYRKHFGVLPMLLLRLLRWPYSIGKYLSIRYKKYKK